MLRECCVMTMVEELTWSLDEISRVAASLTADADLLTPASLSETATIMRGSSQAGRVGVPDVLAPPPLRPAAPARTMSILHFNDVYNVRQAYKGPDGSQGHISAAQFAALLDATRRAWTEPGLVLFSGGKLTSVKM